MPGRADTRSATSVRVMDCLPPCSACAGKSSFRLDAQSSEASCHPEPRSLRSSDGGTGVRIARPSGIASISSGTVTETWYWSLMTTENQTRMPKTTEARMI